MTRFLSSIATALLMLASSGGMAGDPPEAAATPRAFDRLDTRNGVRPYLDGRKQLLQRLAEQLAALRPDILLAYRPSGRGWRVETRPTAEAPRLLCGTYPRT